MDSLLLLKFELLPVVIVFILLFIRVAKKNIETVPLLRQINVLLFINLAVGFIGNREGNLFGEMFYSNELISFQKNILNAGTLLISFIAYPWLKTHKHAAEFYILMLATLTGMFFMISSQHLLMFYLGLELSTIPLAAMANLDLNKRVSSEAAFKMIMSSAFSSGLVLLGISFVYGITGSLEFRELHVSLYNEPIQILAYALLMTGFLFKISAVPFHLWTADVYEGSPIAVTAFLSVISKGAIIFVITSVISRIFDMDWLLPIAYAVSIASMVIGNLFAIRQTNLKRFLAFSSIAQMGFILAAFTGDYLSGSSSAVYFVLIYIFSNLGAFGVITVISSLTNKETLDDYKGLYKSNPFLSWALAISLFSLAGIPPTAGFFGKFFLLLSASGGGHFILVTIAALNMVISLYYYLRLIRTMFMDEPKIQMGRLKLDLLPRLGLLICIFAILAIGFTGNVYQQIHSLFLKFGAWP